MEDRSEKKRDRDGPIVVDSPRSDLTRSGSDPDPPGPKRARVDSDLDSSEVWSLQDELLNILDDSDAFADRNHPAIQGLDSVIRSFEEEILISAPLLEDLDLVSHTELGFLLGASDDELGLPPSFRSSLDEQTVELPATSSGEFGLSDSLPLQSELPNYDSFEFGICGQLDHSNSRDVISTEFVASGGLFDNAFAVDSCDDGGDMSEFLFQPESLPAV